MTHASPARPCCRRTGRSSPCLLHGREGPFALRPDASSTCICAVSRSDSPGALPPRVDVRSCRSLAEPRHAHLCCEFPGVRGRRGERKHRESLPSQSSPSSMCSAPMELCFSLSASSWARTTQPAIPPCASLVLSSCADDRSSTAWPPRPLHDGLGPLGPLGLRIRAQLLRMQAVRAARETGPHGDAHAVANASGRGRARGSVVADEPNRDSNVACPKRLLQSPQAAFFTTARYRRRARG